MTLAEQSYRTAIVALRDGRWEEAVQYLLTLFAEAPDYRDVGHVLIRLEQTRPVEYWCAVFDFSAAHRAWDDASAALKILTKIAPAYPRLAEMQQQLPAVASLESPGASEEAGPVVTNLTQRISAAMAREQVEDHSLKRWLEASALDEKPTPAVTPALSDNAIVEPVEAAPDRNSAADSIWAELASADHSAMLLSEDADSTQPLAVSDVNDSKLADTLQSTPIPPDVPVEIPEAQVSGQASAPPAGEWSEPPELEKTQPRKIIIHESDDKKKRGWADRLMLFLEILALFAIVFIVVVMALNNDDGTARAIDRYGGALPPLDEGLPATMPDLVGAVDRQLVRISEPEDAINRLNDLDGVIGELAGDDQSLATALGEWIAAGVVELQAAAAMNDACTETGVRSAACTAGIEAHEESINDAVDQRELVCDLISCSTN
ncbi:hypothetical protein ACFLYO_04455 [Chloroflexota bacterium]